MLSRRLLLTLALGAVLAAPAGAAEPITGLNVTAITYRGLPTYSDGTFTYRGNGKWTEKTDEGTYKFVEKSKTASRLTLWDSKREAKVIIDVKKGGTLSWVWNGSPVTPYGKIVTLK